MNIPHPLHDHLAIARRGFLTRSAAGLASLATLLQQDGFLGTATATQAPGPDTLMSLMVIQRLNKIMAM